MTNLFAERLLVICMLTNDCNQACKYCSESAGCGNAEMLPYEVVDQLLKDIYSISKESIISFIGGEATIWPGFYDILKAESFEKISLRSLYTNATAISGEHIDSIRDAGFFEVRVSLDSDRQEEHDASRGAGTFHKAVSNIGLMVENDIPVTAGTVLSKSNLNRLEGLIDYFKSLNLKMIHFFPLYMKGRGGSQKSLELSTEDREYIRRKLETNYPSCSAAREPLCESGTWYFKVLCNGDCIVQKDRDKRELGNLFEHRFSELYRKAEAMLNPAVISCKECKYYDNPILCENMHIYCMNDLNFMV
ncbi:MAG: radical SAM protein [Firmicutes bacterium]|nr:radical SAM protein [Bacillota bacterium]